jgi:CRP/FNR family transcriptional regulator, polysaccharide utilization system transcription regulator
MVTQKCENCNVINKTFFKALPKENVLELDKKKTCKIYKKNRTVFTAGNKPDGIYCLNKGKVKLYKTGWGGKEQIVRFAVPGEFFGLRSAVCDNNYTHSAVTIEESHICFISKKDFHEILEQHPHFMSSIIGFISDMLEDANNKLTSLAQKTVRERLAETLIALNKIYNSEHSAPGLNHTAISLTRQDLANLVGTATETIIRQLAEFKHDQLIGIKGRKVSILDLEGLKRIANV